MHIKKSVLIVIFLWCNWHMGLLAQEAIPSSGGDSKGSGGTASYSFGQLFYTTISGANKTATLGVQQTYSILRWQANHPKSAQISLACSAFPNPTNDLLTLKLNENFDLTNTNLSFRLFDINGKLLSTKMITEYSTILSLKNYSSSVYQLQVISNTDDFITFKILKS